MSTKFQQLLDLLVNEETDKANALFHEIVVEKSREIYNNMIAEEAEEDKEDEEEDESVEEASEEEDDESVEESFNDESMYEIGGEEELGGDAADDMIDDVEDHDVMGQDHEEGGNDPATKDDVLDIADALEELKAEFQALLAGEKHEEEGDPDVHGGALDSLDQDGDGDHDMDDHDMEDEEDADEVFMREYREVVGKPYAGGKVAGKTEDSGTNTKSVGLQNPKRLSDGAVDAGNIAQATKGEDRKAGADAKSLAGAVKGEFTKGVEKNISNKASSGMKDGAALNKVAAGHGAEKKGSGETSVNDKNTLPK
jgi:hypothetical protein